MKTMTCQQLGGACNEKFTASSFDEMAKLSRKHGMEMYQKGDKAHIKAMEEMQKIIMTEDGLVKWMEARRMEFDALPNNK